ncbi:MAG: 2,3-bisphosphoglycerate-independent phosphoglycerate mutase [Eubacteriales bacterium]|nr:2,3-bisphosphoglycerate-independent phosphoglycerate mutase [Eubacteriales bacterium]
MNTMLMILDGFGKNPIFCENAIAQANTPNLDRLFATWPNTVIEASGLAVGLPTGQMGNSEVGHLNIGAGRVVYQDLTRITKEIEEGSFFRNPTFNRVMDHVSDRNSSLHLMGLLSDGGVHSHISHLFTLIDFAKRKGIKQVYVHGFLDGRDVPPRSAALYIQKLEDYMKKTDVGKIAMISGRYYAMDRDNRWERVQKAYDALTQGTGKKATSAIDALEMAYQRNENDEFVLPTLIANKDGSVVTIENGDGIILFNFRPDRAREITRCFVDDNFNGFIRNTRPNDLLYVCMTQYDAEMPNVHVAYPPQSLKNTLGEYLSYKGFRQLRIAETEKYAHVTFFFNGGIEAPNNGEDRILIPSPKVATYDLKPEMSAYQVTDRVIEIIKEKKYDFIILNFANPDMVGHTGVIEATIKAIEVLDGCVDRIVKTLQANDGQLILTADHGNADCMLDKKGNVVTAHSLNPVPLLVLSDSPVKLAEGGILADVAPTLLDLAGIEKPAEMTGHSLILVLNP